MRGTRLALAMAATLLAGCGASGNAGGEPGADSDPASGSPTQEAASPLAQMDAGEIVEASLTALEEAGSARATGSIEDGGSTQELDVQLQGDDAQGTVAMDGAALDVVHLDGTAYAKGPAAFWTSVGVPEFFAGRLEGQWVLLPDEAATSVRQVTLPSLLEQLRPAPGEQLTGDVTTDERNGEPVVVVTQEDGTAFTVVDDVANPYPLLIERQGDSPGILEFSEVGEEFDISAPPDPLDLSWLGDVGDFGG